MDSLFNAIYQRFETLDGCAPEEMLWKHALVSTEILALSTKLPGDMMNDMLQEVLCPELNALLDYFTSKGEETKSVKINVKLRRLFNENVSFKADKDFLKLQRSDEAVDGNCSLSP